MIILAAVVLVLLAAATVWFFCFRSGDRVYWQDQPTQEQQQLLREGMQLDRLNCTVQRFCSVVPADSSSDYITAAVLNAEAEDVERWITRMDGYRVESFTPGVLKPFGEEQFDATARYRLAFCEVYRLSDDSFLVISSVSADWQETLYNTIQK